MKNNRPIPGRISYRISGFNYAAPNSWFVTICTHDRACLFGDVIKGSMRRNEIGNIIQNEWMRTAIIRPEIELDEFVVMPNHIHGIIHIIDGDESMGAHIGAPKQNDTWGNTGAHIGAPLRRTPHSLGSIIAGFKSAVTTKINRLRDTPHQPVWQSRYYERVIRNERSLKNIREYIVNNPFQWHLDNQNPLHRKRS